MVYHPSRRALPEHLMQLPFLQLAPNTNATLSRPSAPVTPLPWSSHRVKVYATSLTTTYRKTKVRKYGLNQAQGGPAQHSTQDAPVVAYEISATAGLLRVPIFD